MSSSDETPAVVELPDDADDAASSTDEVGAVARVLFDMFEGPPTGGPVAFHRLRAREVLAAVEPLIAARVRAEALREAAEKIAPNQVRPSNVVVVGARMTDDVLDTLRTVEHALVAAVRAEAVADERQRIKALIDSLITKPLEWERDIYMRDGYRHVLDLLTASSVPVATPKAQCGEISAVKGWSPCDREIGHGEPHTWPLIPPPVPGDQT